MNNKPGKTRFVLNSDEGVLIKHRLFIMFWNINIPGPDKSYTSTSRMYFTPPIEVMFFIKGISNYTNVKTLLKNYWSCKSLKWTVNIIISFKVFDKAAYNPHFYSTVIDSSLEKELTTRKWHCPIRWCRSQNADFRSTWGQSKYF